MLREGTAARRTAGATAPSHRETRNANRGVGAHRHDDCGAVHCAPREVRRSRSTDRNTPRVVGCAHLMRSARSTRPKMRHRPFLGLGMPWDRALTLRDFREGATFSVAEPGMMARAIAGELFLWSHHVPVTRCCCVATHQPKVTACFSPPQPQIQRRARD